MSGKQKIFLSRWKGDFFMLHSYKIALEIILTKFGKIGLGWLWSNFMQLSDPDVSF